MNAPAPRTDSVFGPVSVRGLALWTEADVLQGWPQLDLDSDAPLMARFRVQDAYMGEGVRPLEFVVLHPYDVDRERLLPEHAD